MHCPFSGYGLVVRLHRASDQFTLPIQKFFAVQSWPRQQYQVRYVVGFGRRDGGDGPAFAMTDKADLFRVNFLAAL